MLQNEIVISDWACNGRSLKHKLNETNRFVEISVKMWQ